MSEKKGLNLIRILPFFLSISSITLGVHSLSQPPYIFAAAGCMFLSCTLRAFNRGIFNEILSFLRLLGSFAIGWFFGKHAGEALGLPGILASISGFYLLFFLSFTFLGKLIAEIGKEKPLSMATKVLGAFAGAFEGIILAWVIVFSVYSLPNSKLPEYYPGLFERFSAPVENMLAPVLPEQAQSTMNAVKTAQKLIRGVDPQKVDRQALNEVIMPIAEMPEVKVLQNNSQVQQLIQNRDFKGLIQHPSVRSFLENKDVQQRLMNFDWQKLDKALNQN